jgi:homoserine O-acetyltransferase
VFHNKAIFDVPLPLESGAVLPFFEVAYCTYGTLNAAKDNVVWICHALTANADAADWWDGLVGGGKLFDPQKYFVVCANILGSCYGSTSPVSVNSETGVAYESNFPVLTIRDLVQAHIALADRLGVEQIKLLIGGSLGGQQCMEWAIAQPDRIQNLALIATNARHSAWGIAFNEAQRMALKGGESGLAAARAIAMLSYRNYDMYERTQTDEDDKIDGYRASGYQQYQGEKLSKRFNPHCYYILSKAMDTHNVGRGRGGAEKALGEIKAKTIVVGISSDLLFPLQEQQYLAKHINGGRFFAIDSPYGHDGFLIESGQLKNIIEQTILTA